MFSKVAFDFVSFITLVALEWSLNSVRLHVLLQITRKSARILALVTFVRFFTNVLSHRVNFQTATCNCLIFTLIAFVNFLPSVLLDMRFEG